MLYLICCTKVFSTSKGMNVKAWRSSGGGTSRKMGSKGRGEVQYECGTANTGRDAQETSGREIIIMLPEIAVRSG